MEMLKEALLCGLGMVIDLSGSHYLYSPISNVAAKEAIASDWKHVGNDILHAVVVESPKIEAEAAKQLQLKLG